MILKNASGTPLGPIGFAYSVSVEISYNDLSTISFEVPSIVDGVPTPLYEYLEGHMRVELNGLGEFILKNPEEIDDGICCIKKCKAFSSEYEFSRKKLTLDKKTYKFFDRGNPSDTILGIIMDMMPSWSIGHVSDNLLNKYRTFDCSNQNLYNFIKSTLQMTYGCIFEFDTLKREVNIISIEDSTSDMAIFLSTQNLVEEIQIKENDDDIVTRLDVNGADGVNIRDVNPCGTNKIIDLSYYMTPINFGQDLIDKYHSWEKTCADNQESYYTLSIQYSLKVMQNETERAALAQLKGEYASLENIQAVTIQAIAQKIKTQKDLDKINADLSAKKAEMDAKEQFLEVLDAEKQSIFNQLKVIRDACSYEKFFTEQERHLFDFYIRDGEISDSSFVAPSTGSYAEPGSGAGLSNKTFCITDAEVSTVTSASGMVLYDIRGGRLVVDDFIDATIIQASVEINAGKAIGSIYMSSGTMSNNTFPEACLTITCDCGTVTADEKIFSLPFKSGFTYFTFDTSEYQKRSVAWELYQFGKENLSKLCQPSYTFSINSSNFLSIDDFLSFKNSLRIGQRLVLKRTNGDIIRPILIGVSLDFDKRERLSLKFGDTYTHTDTILAVADLLDKSISMGKNVEISKNIYEEFHDSGANTRIKGFMTSAFDVSKNAILSSSGQAVSWDAAGLRLRKWLNDNHESYEDEQIWAINNSIVMTRDNWTTAQMAIGKFKDEQIGECWGIVAPMIVGTLVAGNSLVIESKKKDGGNAVFRVDQDGCRLYNSDFTVSNGQAHIALNPDIGIAIGSYPIYDVQEGRKTLNNKNARFWVDASGNVHIKGTLHGTDGEFLGTIKAISKDESYFQVNGSSMGFFDKTGKSMFSYNNGTMELDGTIKATTSDGSYFIVRGDDMGFYSPDNKPLLKYQNGGLTMTGAIVATSLLIQSSTSSADMTIDDYISANPTVKGNADAIKEVKLSVTPSHLVATLRSSSEYQQDLASVKLTEDEIVSAVTNSRTYKDDLGGKTDQEITIQIQSTITQHAELIEQRVTSGEVDNKISVALDGIHLNANQISLEGATTINGHVRIGTDGKLTAKDGTFSGSLTAGNWTFDRNGATYRPDSSGAYGRIHGIGGTMYYDTNGMHAQYGADSSHNTFIYGNYIKLTPATASNGICICNSATRDLGNIEYNDPTIICDAANNDGADTSWGGSRGNIGTRYKRWDIGWIKLLHTAKAFNVSTKKVKHNICPLSDLGERLDLLTPVSFVYNWEQDDQISYGLILEDTLPIMPEICHVAESENDEGGINYVALVPLLLKEIQSLRKRLAFIENQIN